MQNYEIIFITAFIIITYYISNQCILPKQNTLITLHYKQSFSKPRRMRITINIIRLCISYINKLNIVYMK